MNWYGHDIPDPDWVSPCGQSVMYHSDCLAVLPKLPSGCVDAVVDDVLMTTTASSTIVGHEKETSAIREQKANAGCEETLGKEGARNTLAIRSSGVVTTKNSRLLRGKPSNNMAMDDTLGHSVEDSRKPGNKEWEIQGRGTKSDVSEDGYKGQVRRLRNDERPGDTPSKRGPLRQSADKSSGSLQFLPHERNKTSVVEGEEGRTSNSEIQWPGRMVTIADPPYGCGKAAWDIQFPTEWYALAKALSGVVCVVTGSAGVRDSVRLVGGDFVDIIAARNLNALTRGPIGFSNWLGTVVACGKPRQGPNAFDFVVMGNMPDHPCPKPIDFMMKLVARVSNEESVVLDPFTGSGTTGVACARLGRRFLGIEIEKRYFDIAVTRIDQELRQGKLFTETTA